VGRAVGADQACAVDGKAHREALDRHVMTILVIASLQEGRIDRAERLVPLGRQSGRERHGVLLGDADIEGSVRESLLKMSMPVPEGIAAVMPTIFSSFFGFLDEALSEYVLIGRCIRLGLCLSAGGDIEFDHRMILVRRRLCRTVALALLGYHMNQHRAGLLSRTF